MTTPDPTAEITGALEYLLALVRKRRSILRGADMKEASQALQTVQTWSRGLKKALDGPTIGQEDVILGCPKEVEPHAMRFHRMHEHAEAP